MGNYQKICIGKSVLVGIGDFVCVYLLRAFCHIGLGDHFPQPRQRFYGSIDELRDRFRVAEGDEKILAQIPESAVTGKRFGTNNKKILVDTTKYEIPEELKGYCRMADLREIMYFIEKEKGV